MAQRPRMQMFNKTDRVLAAIDGKAATESFTSASQEIDIQLIDLPLNQPRKYFNPEKMAQLVASIQEKGILEPLLVRYKSNSRYELVAGERRYRAAQELALTHVPVTIRDFSESEVFEIALIENLQREDLNPVEEVEGVLQLLELKLQISQAEVVSLLYRMENEQKGKVTHNVTGNEDPTHNVMNRVEEILTVLGIGNWLSFVTNKLPLLKLSEDVLTALRKGQIEYTKAKVIARVKDPEERQAILLQAIQDSLSLNQIRQRVASLKPSTAPQVESLQAKAAQTFQLLKKAHLSPDQQQQLSHHLDRIRMILES